MLERRLQNNVAIITGAARGIGQAIASKFAKEGCNLGLLDLDLGGATETAGAAERLGVRALPVRLDVTDRSEVEKAMRRVSEEVGPLDILVNNAGIFEIVQFEEITSSQWQRMLDVNLTSVFHATQCFVRHLLSGNRPGAIVNLASISGQVAFNGSSHYSVAKAGVAQLTRCLAMEYGQYGIRTNAMAPGIIETEITRPAISDERMSEEWMKRIPMRRYGTVEEVADLALFLASDQSSYLNGETITIDGGAVPAWSKPGDADRHIRRHWS